MIKLDGLKKYFSISKGLLKKSTTFAKAVDDISLTINEGEIVGSRINGGDSGAADFTPYNPTDIPPMDGPMPF